ncbi:MAG TPA: hypothetical protein VI122_14635 [Thermoleophilaceae bacterium]
MRVEFLWWEGCPSHPEALAELRDVLRSENLDPDLVERREIATDEQAARERFPGSPTILIDGEDVVAPDDGEPFSLTCRVYRLRDGRYSATPDADVLRAAVRRAKENR